MAQTPITMRLGALYNIVWNRKRKTLQPEETALVQIEIILTDRSKKYVGTGIYLPATQWDQKTRMVTGTELSGRLNKRISDAVSDLRRYEISIIDSGRWMTASDVDAYFTRKDGDGSFVGFMTNEINKRTDIVKGTRDRQLIVVELLKKNGIIQFSDLTLANIKDFDNALRSDGQQQATLAKKHQVVKTYIHRACDIGLMDYGKNPYLKFSVSRGKHAIRTRLDSNEIEVLLGKEIELPYLDNCRDIYAFQIFTGCSYKDLRSLTWSGNIRRNGDDYWIEGLRKKSGEFYSVFLVPEAVTLILKHREPDRDTLFDAPLIWTQNRNLKTLAVLCGFSKRITTHTGRHTAATQMLRSGVSLSTIRDVLGHTKTETTEIYAKLEKATIKEEMLRGRPGKPIG